jgi:ribosomal protein S18 acetylase RimI-like enzyme
MPLRPFALPADLGVMMDLIPPSFQYPDHPEWGVQDDEMESMVDTMRGIRRMWPLVRLIMLVHAPMRDIMRGYIWEEDGQPVGLCNVIRDGGTDVWYIGNVAVLPAYRRRGIARQLVQACLDYARERGAQAISLDVIDANLPAYELYKALGFEHYAGQVELDYEAEDADLPPKELLPDGYTIEDLSLRAWQTHYELAQRITPGAVQRFQPVQEGSFRFPAIKVLLAPLIFQALGWHPYQRVVRATASGQVVAAIRAMVRRRAGGVNQLDLRLDLAHDHLAPGLFNHARRAIMARSPGRRIVAHIRDWQEPLIAAGLEAGFTCKVRMHTLGILM